MSAENDFDDLDALLADSLGEVEEQEKKEPAPAKKAVAKKTTAKKAEPVPPQETPETFSVTVNNPSFDEEALRAKIRAEVLAELNPQAKESPVGMNVFNSYPETGEKEAAEVDLPDGWPKLIHFVEDGFTIGSLVYYRGQEYRVQPEDRWVVMNPRQQRRQYGQMMFKPGPWDGDDFDLDDPALEDEDREKLREIMSQG